jgi:hypothetical protein
VSAEELMAKDRVISAFNEAMVHLVAASGGKVVVPAKTQEIYSPYEYFVHVWTDPATQDRHFELREKVRQ